MASGVYNAGSTGIADRSIDFIADTIKIMLVGTGYIFDPDEAVLTGAAAEEIDLTAGGYVPGFAGSGRKTLASKTITKIDASDRTKFDAADPSAWTLATGEAVKAGVLYKHDTDDATSIPIFYQELPDPIPTNGSTFTFQFHADGIDYIVNG